MSTSINLKKKPFQIFYQSKRTFPTVKNLPLSHANLPILPHTGLKLTPKWNSLFKPTLCHATFTKSDFEAKDKQNDTEDNQSQTSLDLDQMLKEFGITEATLSAEQINMVRKMITGSSEEDAKLTLLHVNIMVNSANIQNYSGDSIIAKFLGGIQMLATNHILLFILSQTPWFKPWMGAVPFLADVLKESTKESLADLRNMVEVKSKFPTQTRVLVEKREGTIFDVGEKVTILVNDNQHMYIIPTVTFLTEVVDIKPAGFIRMEQEITFYVDEKNESIVKVIDNEVIELMKNKSFVSKTIKHLPFVKVKHPEPGKTMTSITLICNITAETEDKMEVNKKNLVYEARVIIKKHGATFKTPK